MAHATIFLATSPKSNSATLALFKAKDLVANEEIRQVPIHLRDAHTSFNKKMGNGADYIYNHDCPNHISGQDYMDNPVEIYKPTNYGAEKQIVERLEFYKQVKKDIKNGRK